MKLEWTEPAVSSLQAIHDYVACDQPFYASRLVARIIQTTERLVGFPKIGRKVPEIGREEVR